MKQNLTKKQQCTANFCEAIRQWQNEMFMGTYIQFKKGRQTFAP